MRTRWQTGEATVEVGSPVSLVVTAHASVADVREALTPQLAPAADTSLILIDLGQGRRRLGASALAQVTGRIGDPPPDLDAPELLVKLYRAIREARTLGLLLAYHDRSDGGLFATLCEMARPLGLTVDLEFVTWSGVRTLDEAVEVVSAARRSNAGIVIDTLHFDRCHAELEKLTALPREWFHFAQISDAPAAYSTEREDLIRIGRAERLYLGEGGIDVASILGRLPQVPLSIEIPNVAKLESLGAEQYARLCIETARSYLAAGAFRRTG